MDQEIPYSLCCSVNPLVNEGSIFPQYFSWGMNFNQRRVFNFVLFHLKMFKSSATHTEKGKKAQ